MLHRGSILGSTLGWAMAVPGVALAGMPSVLPSDLPTRWRLVDSAAERLMAISFFAVGLLVSACVVHVLWNYVQRDFPRLPRLSMLQALAVVILWGLLFVVVLTMISGARELMTPGAWKKQGFTYKLAPAEDEKSAPTAPEVGD
jgi:hypothetical protein